jgi:asparagine synthase (glutamine-hydrolysing)
MAVALEVRAPLLDYRVIEFALANVPSRLKVGQEGSRYLQRELARRLLPKTLDLNRKQGFVMPVDDWLKGSWGDLTMEALSSTDAHQWVDPGVARSLLEGHRKGRKNGTRLFNLLTFALWLEGLRDQSAVCGAAA